MKNWQPPESGLPLLAIASFASGYRSAGRADTRRES
jgi:hypothetical protein